MKNKIIFIGLVLICTISLFAINMSRLSNQEPKSGLLTQNVEALCSDSEGSSGFKLFRVCSKKTGEIYCTAKRGKRKWAIDVTFKLTGVNDEFVCSECEDDDYDYED